MSELLHRSYSLLAAQTEQQCYCFNPG